MDVPRRIVFLPGAAGAADFWRPVAERLPGGWHKTLLGWPGAGEEPHDPRVESFDDLVTLAAAELDAPADVVAQSMGGAVAIGLALRHPRMVRRLVLVATSGGIAVDGLGAADWREEYRAEFPRAAPWVWRERPDHASAIAAVTAPTLLIWGDADPLSPPGIGERLRELLPDASLHVLASGTHALARERPDEVARLIAAHLAR
jgi:pimeloyl-ACP methyl ester carboxylesterase